MMGTNLPHIVLQPLEGNVQYKTEDITNVHFFHYTPDASSCATRVPFKTYQDLVAAAKANPGKLNFAGSGTNSANHAAHERLNHVAGIKTTYVRVQGHRRPRGRRCSAATSTARCRTRSLALAQKGKTRLLAVATPQRLVLVPRRARPSASWASTGWTARIRGIGVPKSTPEDVRRKHLRHVLRDQPRPRFPRADDRARPRARRRHLRQDAAPSWRSARRPTCRRRSCWGS